MAGAEAELSRLRTLQQSLQSTLVTARSNLSAAKRRSLQAAAAGQSVDDQTSLTRLRNIVARTQDEYSYVAAFAVETATQSVLTAKIQEAEARATALECKSATARLGLIITSQQAMMFDPNAAIQFESTDANGNIVKSHSLLLHEEAADIRTHEIQSLRTQLQDAITRAESEQTVMETNGFFSK